MRACVLLTYHPAQGTEEEWATGMHAEQSQIVQAAWRRKKKKWERGGEGEEEKIPLSGQFLWRYLEDNTVIFRKGGGKKRESRVLSAQWRTQKGDIWENNCEVV